MIIHTYSTATNLARRIVAKEISPVEVVDFFLARIGAINPKINAFVTLNENVKAQAQEAEEMIQRGEILGPLHGVPVALKDLTATEGIRTTFGSPAFKDHIPARDATVVKRLKEAGALVLGKTNTPEFGHIGTTDNLLFGATVNPWHLERTAGGSSGGSAAAVAAGLVPLAEGSDGGGSIRIPASFCGVYGFKPTYGRVPYDSHMHNVFGSHAPFLHHGPLTRSVTDAALFLQITQGPSPTDPFSLPIVEEEIINHIEWNIEGLKVAYTPDFGMYEVSSEVKRVVEADLDRWCELGCQVEEVSVDFGMKLDEFIEFFTGMWYASAAAGSGPLLEEHPELVSPSYRAMIEAGYEQSAVEYKRLEPIRTKVWHEMQTLFQTYDLVFSPTLAVTAFDHKLLGPEEINGKPIQPASDWMLTQVYNVTGLPAASIPIGFSREGLPIGLQLAANRFEDTLVLRASRAYEKVFGIECQPPLA